MKTKRNCARCILRCALNSQHIQKQTSLWTEPLWAAENTGSQADRVQKVHAWLWNMQRKQAWWRDKAILRLVETTLKTFYVIMKSINIFSVYYETVAGQIRLWLANEWETLIYIQYIYIYIYTQGSRLILPTGRFFVTNFLSWSHKHIIWSQFFFFFFLLQHLIKQCMLMNFDHSL